MLYPPRSFKVCLKILIYFELTFLSGPNCCLACVYPVLRTPFTKMTVFSLLCVPAWKCCVSLYLGSVFCFTDLYVYSYASTILFWLNFYIKNDKNLMKEVEKDTNKLKPSWYCLNQNQVTLFELCGCTYTWIFFNK